MLVSLLLAALTVPSAHGLRKRKAQAPNATSCAGCESWCESDYTGGNNQGRHCQPGDMAARCGGCSFCQGPCEPWCESDYNGGNNQGRHCFGDMASLCGGCNFCKCGGLQPTPAPGPPVPAPTPVAAPTPVGGTDYDESYAVKIVWINQAMDQQPHVGGTKAPLRDWTCFACARVPGVSDVQIVEDLERQTLGIVAKYNGECLVSFRGSKTPLNYEYNQRIGFEWHPDSYGDTPPCYYCRTHSGYSEIWSGLRDGVKSALQRLSCGDKRLQVTGHSLGGGIAALAAWELMDDYDVRRIYTLGEVPTGDSRWVEARRARFAAVSYFRITHYKDNVPLLHRIIVGGIPGARYQQAGPEVYYRSTRLGEYTICPGGDDAECQHQWCTWSLVSYTCDQDLGRHGSCDHCSYLGLNPCQAGAEQFQCWAP